MHVAALVILSPATKSLGNLTICVYKLSLNTVQTQNPELQGKTMGSALTRAAAALAAVCAAGEGDAGGAARVGRLRRLQAHAARGGSGGGGEGARPVATAGCTDWAYICMAICFESLSWPAGDHAGAVSARSASIGFWT